MSLNFPKPEDMHPHVTSRQCGRCRKPLQPGDRVTMAFIFTNIALDPVHQIVPGAELSEEFELVHIHCGDPRLNNVGTST